jgi:rhamnosyltransferase
VPTIAAIATAFHPDDRLVAVVEAATSTCVEVIVVDNTPGDGPFLTDRLSEVASTRVIRPGRNLGLAAALNAGVAALSDEVDTVLFLDQDSVLGADLVKGLAAHLDDPTIGVAAPAAWDEQQGRYYEPGTERGPDVTDRDAVITSGMLVKREVLERVGPFREEFFVDHVDNDFCLRVRVAGYRIVRDKRHKLAHSLGQRNQHKLPGVTVSSSRHPTWRLYWIARNGVVLIREHRKTAPTWTRVTGVYLVRWFLLRTLIEAPRRERAGVMLRGFRDGFRGRVDRAYLPAGAEIPAPTSESASS